MNNKTLVPSDWESVHTLSLPFRERSVFSFDDLGLSAQTRSYLSVTAKQGIYGHQKKAIAQALRGKNVCIATGTASGKSLVFYATALEKIVENPQARVCAIYPTKALAVEQEARWKKAFRDANLSVQVGRIDGNIAVTNRVGIVRNSSVLILTPDVIHAWLLSSLAEKAVLNFLTHLELFIVDEVHDYTGVFGSNSAFLFRRIQHILHLLGASPQYICASATIAEPLRHLQNLFGTDFSLIGQEEDTSPSHQIQIRLIRPPSDSDLLSQSAELLRRLANEDTIRFIAFVDSRKQTELLASILSRSQEKDDDSESLFKLDFLERLDVLPFRSGYEEEDRKEIQDRLSTGRLRGIVSTSALELGIDIPFLNCAVLLGVPRSATSLFQRIGRVGRHMSGEVLVVNTGTLYDETVFREPESFMNRPLAEGALYLENKRIQYIHALCLARNGGEHDQVTSLLNLKDENEFDSPVNFPDGFIELCRRERLGEITADLQNMKAESGDDPNHIFPLRDVETQYKVHFQQGPEQRFLGSLSFSQLMREAYPGAIYYYMARPYRIYRVNSFEKKALARREKNYTTKPQMLPTLIFPNLSEGNIFRAFSCSELIATECNLQVRESLSGYKERRGPNEVGVSYPTATDGIYFKMPRFTRNYFTSGLVLTHPILNAENVKCDLLAEVFFESFLMLIPFERRDISFAIDKHRVDRGPIAKDSKFIAVYDQTYGSLRLSGRLLEGDILQQTFELMAKLLLRDEVPGVNRETLSAATTILECFAREATETSLKPEEGFITPANCERIIVPKSRGVNILRNNEEFEVEAVFYSPLIGGLSYRGRYLSTTGEVTDIVSIKSIVEIPGESIMGFYNFESGEITTDQQAISGSQHNEQGQNKES